MADSPEKNSDGVIKLTVYSEGKKLAESIKVVDVLVRKAINIVPVSYTHLTLPTKA